MAFTIRRVEYFHDGKYGYVIYVCEEECDRAARALEV